MLWVYTALAFLIAAAFIYMLIPDLFLHYGGIGSWKRQYTPGVALTFDDGPDPVITPLILDVLDRYQVKATFFVVGQQAERYPDIIRLIRSRGHALGVHSQHHRFAWGLPPRTTWQEWDEGVATLERLTGEEVKWMRPPWGTFNLSTWLWLKNRHKQAVLWDVEGHDWQVRRSPEDIVERILKRVREGSIVLLHDSGGDKGAPVNTLNALDSLCRRIIDDLKLPLVALELPAWSGRHRLFIRLWTKWEQLFAKLFKIERVSSTSVFRISRSRYSGPALYSPNGQLLAQKGDLVGEIHFDNGRLQHEGSTPGEKGVHLLRQVRRSLPALAQFVADNPDYQNVSVLVGLTLLNQGAQHLGFQVQELPPTLFVRLMGFWQRGIMLVYKSKPSKTTAVKPKRSNPRLVWMSKQQLLENWL
ncbi:MAG: polysaccharide deacetylase family protein [Syntrophomonadaceae bacterium]|nr:polysaccharide deacetylase family protein [Syntrophomonadaceae bacterium]